MGKFGVKHRITLCLLCLLALASCHSSRNITKKDAEGSFTLNTKQLLQQVKECNYRFEGLEVNRMNGEVELEGVKANFKGTMKAQCQEFVDLMATKIIPIARASLTPDKVQVISYLQKGYYEGDYALLAEKFGLLVDFQFVQSVLTGSFSELHQNRLRPSAFNCYIEKGNYVLKWKQYKSFGEGQLFEQTVCVHPTTYQVVELRLKSVADKNTELRVNYANHQEINGQQVPTEITVVAKKGDILAKAKLQMSKITLHQKIESSFSISDRYQKLKGGF